MIDSVAGRAVLSLLIIVIGLLVAVVGSRLVSRSTDPFARYNLRKLVRYIAVFVTLVVVAALWRAFAGEIGVVLGLAAAGIAFAMQEVIGALAGWVNILSGRVYRIGDRIELGGVRGDVIDITPLRTKVMEIGKGEPDPAAPVYGRQFTGRLVAVSNKKTFTEPVFNYSAAFDFIWDELQLPISHRSDWRRARSILEEEIAAISDEETARHAVEDFLRSYPLARAEVEARVFARATDNYIELSARFPIPVRRARNVKDDLTVRVLDRLEDAGIEVGSATLDVAIRREVA